jgi:hypothetical protein
VGVGRPWWPRQAWTEGEHGMARSVRYNFLGCKAYSPVPPAAAWVGSDCNGWSFAGELRGCDSLRPDIWFMLDSGPMEATGTAHTIDKIRYQEQGRGQKYGGALCQHRSSSAMRVKCWWRRI